MSLLPQVLQANAMAVRITEFGPRGDGHADQCRGIL